MTRSEDFKEAPSVVPKGEDSSEIDKGRGKKESSKRSNDEMALS